ncbi:hypothetical protein H2198_000962 [Neophaeococcomyces mojaviensis]|uniref:Uncharacterized protein n=1 Tax=Neophaeococcomyces mojaviensis TaxID=3383035 RepID=A0ACC3AIB6_9EURO|nr:hypothetical protein H2198_000962 [Knufia sp. JES_112]
MMVVLLVLHDPAKDFRRIEVRRTKADELKGEHTKEIDSSGALQNGSSTVRKRTNVADDQTSPKNENGVNASGSPGHVMVWQNYPKDGFLHLIDWSIDLITSFRGIHWNFRAPLKTYMIRPPEGDPPALSEEARVQHKQALQRLRYTATRNFILYYLLIDFLKTVLVTEPYFLGIAPLDSPTTWPWLAALNALIPGNVITRFVRLSVIMGTTVTALTFIFSLSPLFFATVLPYLIGEDRLYSLTKSPLLEVWMYPAQWGNMFTNLCNKGLAGMWGIWWHQMFRYGISEPSRILIQKLNINPRGQLGRAIQLFIAFGLTASIHASASSTTFSVIPSKPWDPFIFFISQAFGIIVQTAASKQLNKMMKFPKLVRQIGNFTFVFVLMWFVGPFLADDFARCGIWLFEPIPVSFLRGLGFGPGDTWIPWLSPAEGGRWLGWYDGGAWYKSAIGIY